MDDTMGIAAAVTGAGNVNMARGDYEKAALYYHEPGDR